jgi:glycosyltransferase involved in cell wall biosynthesis
MRIVQLTNDNREIQRKYHLDEPVFGPAPQALLEGFKALGKEVEVHVVSCLQQVPRHSPTKLADNIFYHPLHVPKIGWLRTGYQGCIRATRRKLQEIQPDIVHGQGTERDCAMCAVRSGFPAVLTLHGVMRDLPLPGWNISGLYYLLARRLETLAVSRCSGLICISPRVAALTEGLVPRSWNIPNAIRPEFLAPREGFARPKGPLHLVNVGVISPLKRQRELLAILRELQRTNAFSTTFVGRLDLNSEYARAFRAELRETDRGQGRFSHIESLEPDGLVRLFDEADALVHYSQTESFGLVFAEALARGLPVLTTAVGAIEALPAPTGKTHLAPTSDEAAFVKMLRNWFQEYRPDLQRPQAPTEPMLKQFAPLAVARRHMDAYREVLAASEPHTT